MNRLICILLFFPMMVLGQANLVPNPSFEEYDHCSNSSQGLGWADDWMVPEQGYSPDYFNVCSQISSKSVPENFFGTQEPVIGNGYMGLVSLESPSMEVRDAITCHLLSSLAEGQTYVFKMYVSLSDFSSYQISTVGYKLSLNPLSGPTPIVDYEATYSSNTPLGDKENWMVVTDTVVAQGGEQYLTIANFMSDAMSDSVYVGNGTNGDRAYYYIDDVSLIPLDSLLSVENHESIEVDIYPNPCVDVLNVELVDFSASVEMTVADVNGKIVCANGDCFGRSSLAMTHQGLIDVSAWPSGIYVLKGMDEKGRSFAVKVVKL